MAVYFLTTVTARHEVLPAVSLARMVTVFVPTRSGIAGAFHDSVPAATPESPVEVLQVMVATGRFPFAVPLNVMLEPLVAW